MCRLENHEGGDWITSGVIKAFRDYKIDQLFYVSPKRFEIRKRDSEDSQVTPMGSLRS